MHVLPRAVPHSEQASAIAKRRPESCRIISLGAMAVKSLSEQLARSFRAAAGKLLALSLSDLSAGLPFSLEEPGSGSATTVTYYSTMELNGWEVQKLDRFLQEGQGMAREVMREKPDDFVRDETRREFLVLRLYDHLLLRLDATHVSRAGRVCADRLWDSSPPCVSDR
ncbi:uncharacterized protein [Oryza sativa Japonica Group]|nr:uncharacterized protein LOC107277557 [Oryza sativa Japonica Group]